jgi:hypothetical protein
VNKFGIVIACCTSDAHYAKACVYSIRHFLGDVPVCLFVDGDTGIFFSATRIPGVTIMWAVGGSRAYPLLTAHRAATGRDRIIA